MERHGGECSRRVTRCQRSSESRSSLPSSSAAAMNAFRMSSVSSNRQDRTFVLVWFYMGL